jgi:surface antigen
MTRPSVFRSTLGALALAAALAPGLATAQINPFRGRGAEQMTAQDLNVVADAVRRLLARDPLPDGTVEPWRNEKTGASGSVRAGHSLIRHDLSCRQIHYSGQTARGLHPRSGELDWCRTPDGTWKIAS